MTKRYIKIDGHWYRVYTKYDWWDGLCWILAVSMLLYAGYIVVFRGLAC